MYFKKKIKGFSLIELLVVVAILGVIASIGVVSYNGYVSSTKMKNTENIMRQVSLGQSEYYSLGGVYFEGSCPPNKASSKKVQDEYSNATSTLVKKFVDSNQRKRINLLNEIESEFSMPINLFLNLFENIKAPP